MDKYGLIGYPLGHSFSKNFFNEKFEDEDIDAQYLNFELPNIESLPEVIDMNPELKGLNVTIPYKEKVISYLDYISPEAMPSELSMLYVCRIRARMLSCADTTVMSSASPRV